MTLKKKSVVLGGILFLAACGGGGIGATGIGSLGADFVAMFNADPNSEPVDAQDVDIADISFTTDPFNP